MFFRTCTQAETHRKTFQAGTFACIPLEFTAVTGISVREAYEARQAVRKELLRNPRPIIPHGGENPTVLLTNLVDDQVRVVHRNHLEDYYRNANRVINRP